MDLEDLKAGWSVLNEQLEKNKILNERMVKEMITMRTKSVYDKLWNFEIRNGFLGNLFMALCILPFMHFYLDKNLKTALPSIMSLPSFIIMEVVVVGCVVLSCWALYYLSKIEQSNSNVCEIVKPFLKYKLIIRWSNLLANVVGMFAAIAYIWIERIYFYLPLAVYIGLVLGVVLGVKQWHFYQKNIKEVEKSIEELREFEA